jgi:hypothetical protein
VAIGPFLAVGKVAGLRRGPCRRSCHNIVDVEDCSVHIGNHLQKCIWFEEHNVTVV